MSRTPPKFLYPSTDEIEPIDRIGQSIIHAMARRNWAVPGISCEFEVVGSGDCKQRVLMSLRSADTLVQCTVSGDIRRIIIPTREIEIWRGESPSLTLHIYTGENWQTDAQEFMSEHFKGSSRYGWRWYLTLKDACRCRDTNGAIFSSLAPLVGIMTGDPDPWSKATHQHDGRLSPLMLPDHPKGSGVSLGHGPIEFYTPVVLAGFGLWLEHVLLAQILATPAPDEQVDMFHEDDIPFPSELGPFYTLDSDHAAQRLQKWRLGQQLEPAERYGLAAGDHCLMPYSARHAFAPSDLFDGVGWAAFGEVTSSMSLNQLTIRGVHLMDDYDKFVFRITPNRANGIFVVDNAAYLAAITSETPSWEEKEAAEVARLKTMVPIADYHGGFEQPLLISIREFDLDEVELVSGPWPYFQLTLRLQRDPVAWALLLGALNALSGDNADPAAYMELVEALARRVAGDNVIRRAARVRPGRLTKRRLNQLCAYLTRRLIPACVESQDYGLF